MGNLRITDSGLRLEGRAEFIGPLYAQNITSDQVITLICGSVILHLNTTDLLLVSANYRYHIDDHENEG